MNTDEKILTSLYAERFGLAPESIVMLPGGGGDRRYYRLTAPAGSVVGVIGDTLKDCKAFVELSGVFRNYNVPVPEIFAVSSDGMAYLEEDLGSCSLFDVVTSAKSPADYRKTVQTTLAELVRMQTIPYDDWKDAAEYSPFARRLILWDLNYFKYELLKPAGIDFDEESLEDDFVSLADKLLSLPERLNGFMMRDCQSRNVMLAPSPVFIDYQGGRFGPCVYDAVAFLWQARAGYPIEFRREMLRFYAEQFSDATGVSPREVLEAATLFVLFRTLQVLGAYGFRGLVQKRAHFIVSIPGALSNLRELVGEGAADSFPELKRVCRALVESPRFTPVDEDRLTVKVFSFSYKKGYPEDLSGNGGGFMFDCRGIHNPGRYEEYKPLTGRDEPVKEFLRNNSTADDFARKAIELVVPSVEVYLRRGFSSLQIGFGCTGGRHRSVYCAESVARELARKFPDAKVVLIHREQGVKEKL